MDGSTEVVGEGCGHLVAQWAREGSRCSLSPQSQESLWLRMAGSTAIRVWLPARSEAPARRPPSVPTAHVARPALLAPAVHRRHRLAAADQRRAMRPG